MRRTILLILALGLFPVHAHAVVEVVSPESAKALVERIRAVSPGNDVAAVEEVEVTGGKWSMEAGGIVLTADPKRAHGRFFGPNADETGGAWGMVYEKTGAFTDAVAATGVWAGRKRN